MQFEEMPELQDLNLDLVNQILGHLDEATEWPIRPESITFRCETDLDLLVIAAAVGGRFGHALGNSDGKVFAVFSGEYSGIKIGAVGPARTLSIR